MESIGLDNVKKLNKLLRLGSEGGFRGNGLYEQGLDRSGYHLAGGVSAREQALEVAKQYRMALKKAKSSDKLDSNTLLKGPRGRFLLGLDDDVESTTNPHLMNQIQSYLP